ncbi:MAG: DNA replication complex GINS family protein [Thermoplasmata archaeon]|nr:DNA replication complex GINS family protein [Thermoplasmata archaeon]
MAEEDPFREIMKKIAEVYEAEKGRPSLYPLEEAFYSDVIKFLRHLWDRYLTSQESPKESAKAPLYLEEYRNFKRILTQIYLRREKKIVRLAISAAYGGHVNTDPLTTTEMHLLNEISKALKWHREVSLGDYLSGVSPSVSVDTTTEEFSTSDVVTPPPKSVPATTPPMFTAPGEKVVKKLGVGEGSSSDDGGGEVSGESSRLKKEVLREESVDTVGESMVMGEGGVGTNESLHELQRSMVEGEIGAEGRTIEHRGEAVGEDTKVKKQQGGGGVKGVEMKRGELFGLKEVLVLEEDVGDVVTAREKKLHLRKGEILYTDKEFMEAIEKGGFGRILHVED